MRVWWLQTLWMYSTRYDCIACVCVGNCGQYLRGGMGYHQTWHILWDQRVTSSATASHLQSHQVNAHSRSLAHAGSQHAGSQHTGLCFHQLNRLLMHKWGNDNEDQGDKQELWYWNVILVCSSFHFCNT